MNDEQLDELLNTTRKTLNTHTPEYEEALLDGLVTRYSDENYRVQPLLYGIQTIARETNSTEVIDYVLRRGSVYDDLKFVGDLVVKQASYIRNGKSLDDVVTTEPLRDEGLL